MLFGRREMLRRAAGLAAALPALGDVGPAQRPTRTSAVWVRTELYFGTAKPVNQQVTDSEFNDFVATEVTARFPDGLTLLSGYGQFRSSTGVLIREKSYLLILLYPPQMRDAHDRIEQIRDLYKLSFSQESVLRVDSLSLVSF